MLNNRSTLAVGLHVLILMSLLASGRVCFCEGITEVKAPVCSVEPAKEAEHQTAFSPDVTDVKWITTSSGVVTAQQPGAIFVATIGQDAVGHSSSASYQMHLGFWEHMTGPRYLPGDADGSNGVDIDDVVYLIAYIFTGGYPPIPYVCCGDSDGSGGVDIDDVVYLIAYIFSGGSAPIDAC